MLENTTPISHYNMTTVKWEESHQRWVWYHKQEVRLELNIKRGKKQICVTYKTKVGAVLSEKSSSSSCWKKSSALWTNCSVRRTLPVLQSCRPVQKCQHWSASTAASSGSVKEKKIEPDQLGGENIQHQNALWEICFEDDSAGNTRVMMFMWVLVWEIQHN